MEITRHNFKESIKTVLDAITSADVIAIDTEFSGLEMGSGIHAFDTPEERYSKLVKAVQSYIVLQYGLSTFRLDKDSKRYDVRSFNFYVCPRQFSRSAPDVRFSCQSSSIDFLACQGFDFNKTFRDGISYMLPSDANGMLNSLRQKHEADKLRRSAEKLANKADSTDQTPPGFAAVDEKHQQFIDNIVAKAEQFLQSSDPMSFDIEPCNGYMRKLVYETFERRFAGKLHLVSVTDDRKQRHLRVQLASKCVDDEDHKNEKQLAECQEIDDARGFAKVIEMISKSGKLVIGHNMILDVLHTIEHFITPLPKDYNEFKELAKCVFPRLVDTKHMAFSEPFRDFIVNTALGDMFLELHKAPFTVPEVVTGDDFPRYGLDSEQLHEAGYDSFITGLCFLTMAKYLGTKLQPASVNACIDERVVNKYINRLNLMRIRT